MSDFSQAIKWMKDGKKVRRKGWKNKSLFCKISAHVWNGKEYERDIYFFNISKSFTALNFKLALNSFEADDWEIYEEKSKAEELLRKIVEGASGSEKDNSIWLDGERMLKILEKEVK